MGIAADLAGQVLTAGIAFDASTNSHGVALTTDTTQLASGNLSAVWNLSGGSSGNGTVFRLSLPIGPPQLTIIPSGANVILTWPTNAAGFLLESTPSLTAPNWQPAPETPVATNGQRLVTTPADQRERYFRLQEP